MKTAAFLVWPQAAPWWLHHDGCSGDFSTLIVTSQKRGCLHVNEHSITHPMASSSKSKVRSHAGLPLPAQCTLPCNVQLPFHNAPLNPHQIVTALSQGLGLSLVSFQSPSGSSSAAPQAPYLLAWGHQWPPHTQDPEQWHCDKALLSHSLYIDPADLVDQTQGL